MVFSLLLGFCFIYYDDCWWFFTEPLPPHLLAIVPFNFFGSVFIRIATTNITPSPSRTLHLAKKIFSPSFELDYCFSHIGLTNNFTISFELNSIC